mmetsp:Transcript_8714/g.21247  ORF Transcript_8714/g.21247 Transcript_8714/m.21247 type:complete len:250 (+) Transcript_8714:266-1015(+)
MFAIKIEVFLVSGQRNDHFQSINLAEQDIGLHSIRGKRIQLGRIQLAPHIRIDIVAVDIGSNERRQHHSDSGGHFRGESLQHVVRAVFESIVIGRIQGRSTWVQGQLTEQRQGQPVVISICHRQDPARCQDLFGHITDALINGQGHRHPPEAGPVEDTFQRLHPRVLEEHFIFIATRTAIQVNTSFFNIGFGANLVAIHKIQVFIHSNLLKRNENVVFFFRISGIGTMIGGEGSQRMFRSIDVDKSVLG